MSIWQMICLSVALVFSANGEVLAETTANLLSNPGFEQVNQSNWPTGWNTNSSANASSDDQTARPGGSRSLRISLPVAAGTVWVKQPIQVIPGSMYNLAAWIKTQNVTGPGALVFIEWTHQDGTWYYGNYDAPRVTGTQDWQFSSVENVQIPPDAGTNATVFVALLAGSAGTAWFDDVLLQRLIDPLMSTSLVRPGYANKILPGAPSPEIEVAITLNPEDYGLTLAELRIVTKLNDSTGTPVEEEHLDSLSLNNFPADLDIPDGLPPGDYHLVIGLYKGENLLAQDTYPLEKVSGLTSYIDSHNRFILNGEPFFPLGLYVAQCTNGSYSAELDEIANSPFDTLMNYAVNRCGTDASDAQILAYLDQLKSRNLKLVFSLLEYFDGAPPATATWTFNVDHGGSYEVYTWWKATPNRATDAPYTIFYDGGSQTIRVNQETNGGVWNLLGTFPFVTTTSGSVVLGNDANEYVIADAVRVEGAGSGGADIIIDQEEATYESSWTLLTSTPSAYNNDLRYHAKFVDDIETIAHKINISKTHPTVISWYLNDERDPATYLTQLEERYQKIRELDQNHPVWAVHWNTDWLLQEAHTTDIVGVDPYPIDNNPITLVSTMADAAVASGKPLWLVPQIFSWTDYPGDSRAATGRHPTRDEMRAMTYLATNHGAKGLIYYSYFNIRDDEDIDPDPDIDTSYEARWPQIKEIAGEVDFLRPVLLSIDEANDSDVTCNNSNIDLKLMRTGHAYYLFAVNTKEQNVADVSFQNNLADKPGVIEALFEEGRQIAVTNGIFTDNFDPYEVHAYFWSEHGDVDCDGIVDLADAILTFQTVAGLSAAGMCFSADVNGDGKIGLFEVIYILQYITGLR